MTRHIMTDDPSTWFQDPPGGFSDEPNLGGDAAADARMADHRAAVAARIAAELAEHPERRAYDISYVNEYGAYTMPGFDRPLAIRMVTRMLTDAHWGDVVSVTITRTDRLATPEHDEDNAIS